MHTASRLVSGKVAVPPDVATPLPNEERATTWVMVWNTTDVPLGIGDANIDTDQMLHPGESITLWVTNPEAVFLLHHDSEPADVYYTIGV